MTLSHFHSTYFSQKAYSFAKTFFYANESHKSAGNIAKTLTKYLNIFLSCSFLWAFIGSILEGLD